VSKNINLDRAFDERIIRDFENESFNEIINREFENEVCRDNACDIGKIYLLYWCTDILVCATASESMLKQVVAHRLMSGELEYDGGSDINKFSEDFDTKDIDYVNNKLDRLTRLDIVNDGEILW